MATNARDYQEVIELLGERGIIPKDFASRNKKLAGYRNRLVHMYLEITPDEIYAIMLEHLGDLRGFAEYFRKVGASPGDFGLEIRE